MTETSAVAPQPPPAGGPPSAPGPATGDRLPGDDPADRRQLPARVIAYWRLRGALFGLLVLGVLGLLAWQTDWFTPAVRWSLVAVVAGLLVVTVLVAPPIRYRIFWYAVSPEEIDISTGLYVRTRTVIPMSRVQHLRTDHGPIADRFRVATLHIHTAAGTVRLADLDRDEAEQVRTRIAALAQVSDDV
jgi:membrane protein YdbS with pleckstrin-like domain